MHIEDFNSLKHKLEPEASAGSDSGNESLILSMAVSAKRQADALERIADLMKHNQLPLYDGRLLIDSRF
jgi:hypothetical protein